MICPNCGRNLGNSLLRFEWCPGDRAYFCKSCTRERAGCPACKSKPAGIHLGVAGLVLFIVLVVSAAAILPQHISRSFDIQTDPVDFGNATAGKDVKLLTNLKSNTKQAFVLILRDDRWQLLMKANVSVVDGKGKSIRLDLTACHDFAPLFHNKSNTTRSEYQSGDRVTVFGKVKDDGAGNKTLEVRRLFPGEKDPYALQPGWYQNLWLIPVFTMIMFLQVMVFYLYRRHLHSRYAANHPVADGGVLDPDARGKEIAWKDSPVLATQRKRSRTLTLFSVLLFSILLATSALAPWVWSDFSVPMALALLVLLLTIMSSYYYWESTHNTPAVIGFSLGGLHFMYRPRKGPEQTVTLPWKDIQRASSATEFGTSHMKFYTEKRIEDVIVPKELLRAIEEEHAKNVYPGM